jgi:hypothetical protein
MSYQILQPPFPLRFDEMPTKEIKDYFSWFKSIVAERVVELTAYVRQDPISRNWEPDYSTSSLEALGDWFSRHVSTRERTQAEMDELKGGFSHPIDIPNYDLTNESFSLGFDVGVYLGLALMKKHPSLSWDLNLKNKKFVDYGQPLIVGFGATPLNPVRIGINLAYGLASKKNSGGRLREIYDVWSARAQ